MCQLEAGGSSEMIPFQRLFVDTVDGLVGACLESGRPVQHLRECPGGAGPRFGRARWALETPSSRRLGKQVGPAADRHNAQKIDCSPWSLGSDDLMGLLMSARLPSSEDTWDAHCCPLDAPVLEDMCSSVVGMMNASQSGPLKMAH